MEHMVYDKNFNGFLYEDRGQSICIRNTTTVMVFFVTNSVKNVWTGVIIR